MRSARVVAQAAAGLNLTGKRVLTIIPDGTRTMPMPLMFQLLQQEIGTQAAACDYLVALGTHSLMSETQLTRLMGRPVVNGTCGKARVFNHRWDLPDTFVDLGTIPADQVAEASGGLLSEADPGQDQSPALRLRPGLDLRTGVSSRSGGVFGRQQVSVSRSQQRRNDQPDALARGSARQLQPHRHACTPVRALIDQAAEKITVPVACFALVLRKQDIAGIYFGSAQEAWKAAAELSAREHVRWEDRPFRRVLSVLPEMYDDIWTGAKGMYKLEPAIADGGEVVLYAPHITEFSYTHGAFLDRIGYHCRDYFLKQWDRFADVPRGVIAHSTHLIGQGTYDATTGVETLRIKVTLATGIPEERCRRLNLNYIDPKSIRFEDWQGREDEGTKLVPHAGETLYRLKNGVRTGDSGGY